MPCASPPDEHDANSSKKSTGQQREEQPLQKTFLRFYLMCAFIVTINGNDIKAFRFNYRRGGKMIPRLNMPLPKVII